MGEDIGYPIYLCYKWIPLAIEIYTTTVHTISRSESGLSMLCPVKMYMYLSDPEALSVCHKHLECFFCEETKINRRTLEVG